MMSKDSQGFSYISHMENSLVEYTIGRELNNPTLLFLQIILKHNKNHPHPLSSNKFEMVDLWGAFPITSFHHSSNRKLETMQMLYEMKYSAFNIQHSSLEKGKMTRWLFINPVMFSSSEHIDIIIYPERKLWS